ncbi:MAG: NrdH-redoxin [Candidatus Tagabacteria bacterium CG09_land_8_20_14_0_10_41_14]|uniref:NrdH-redoxin n=2 Tax=Candidatus Tagaibacteriota TaxID=1817918 RepID=A0A2H0WLN1_9BACT|nr:MAG: NrdH-redoxin [Candidatus Tagabacteria bacterium CG09_land_8_20_14_0_10_41_14]PJE72851.1 MAG: NrdH-redoxin [Candidatus Tagabacteria bacterium CG10_big_fil_rev_8_21_14_0_10_40_13]
MQKVFIYSAPTCGYCQMAKEWFKENNIEYEEFDVSTDEAKRNELVEKTRQMAIPVIEINGETIVGFDKAKLSELLGV